MTARCPPKGFLWGTATAAHQVEGGNTNSDCWALEHAKPSVFTEPSGAAVDHYNRFDADLDIVQSLGLNAYRFSIEWARIEPEPSQFSQSALDHYQRVIDACHTRCIAPVVTFHHFTQPLWMAGLGGFGSNQFADRFAEYCGRSARALDGMALACTINEINLPVLAAPYFQARADEDQRCAAERALGSPLSSFFLFSPANDILTNGLAAHAKGRDAIRSARSKLPVGMTIALSEETAEPGAEPIRDDRRERFYAPFFDAAKDDDFVGIQNYSRAMSRASDGGVGPAPGAPVTTMGWEDRPQALGEVCQWVSSRWNIPMVVTENGYPGEDDGRRSEFIDEAIAGLRCAMKKGADVRGYFYWSLLDNFEWMLGYRQRFGLVAVDPETFARSVKPSAGTLGKHVRAEEKSSRATAPTATSSTCIR